MQKLPRSFYNRDTITVARELLGMWLVKDGVGGRRVGRIVEVEAYLGPHDRASHSARGLTDRNRIMFGQPGHAYVYLIYGVHHCFNVVTEADGHGSAVLVRAIEPVSNVDQPAHGPGLVCRALRIDRQLNGADLLGEDLYLSKPNSFPRFAIVRRPRIGVEYAGQWARRLLRFYIKGSPCISRR
jgi:DNA-3-methyladenine glycosylase